MPEAKAKPPTFTAWDDPNAYPPVAPWPSGNVFLDHISGIGGLPRGRVVETYGPESSGKTTLAFQVAAYVWRTMGIPSLFWDAEDAFDPRYASALGLDSQGLRLFDRDKTETLEDFLGQLKAALQPKEFAKNPFALVIVDSVAAARCVKELEGGVDLRTIGMEKARIWSDNLRVLVKLLGDTDATLVLVNQLRDNINTDSTFMPPGVAAMQPKTRTPGGRGIKFYASLRIEYDPTAEVKEDRWNPVTLQTEKTVIGKKVWMKVTKNKVAPPPWRKVRVEIRDGMGFDLAQNLLDFAELHGILKRDRGVWTFPAAVFGWPDDFTVQGTDGFTGDAIAAQVLRERPDIAATITARVVDILQGSLEYRADRPPTPDPEDLAPLPPLEAPAP